ncbi:TadE/TadG family type IV pilus assembly protein [Paenibacillus sp. KS-LC4]|uniref:TadE/TadG family type IV pilus assembly protein n=1 Tax=Paenibacillus sp. KS-LC4 TaxID=2979727 RepID=UPI0030CF8ACE
MTKQTKFSLRTLVRKWLCGEQGSFTLESTLVFPLLLTVILLFLLLGMYMYQKTVLYYSTSTITERAAFSWDNSFRNSRTGLLPEGKYDSLYWRMNEDRMLSSLFGSDAEAADLQLVLPLQGAAEDSLPEQKMAAAARWIAAERGLPFEGSIDYHRSVIQRHIETKLLQQVSLQPLERVLGIREPKAVASSPVTDPVDFIRGVDLIRYYTAKFAGGPQGGVKEQASQVLSGYSRQENKRNAKESLNGGGK